VLPPLVVDAANSKAFEVLLSLLICQFLAVPALPPFNSILLKLLALPEFVKTAAILLLELNVAVLPVVILYTPKLTFPVAPV
jgi:hypothetical protein